MGSALERVRRGARLTALRGALAAAHQLGRASSWLVRRVRDAASIEEAHALTAERFARMHDYREAWHREAGLFDFERRALERAFPQPPAHLLVHGAGGGREVFALLERGYRVTAAEPVRALVSAARAALGDRARIVEVGLEGHDEALAGPFDGVIVGWGALGHVLDRGSRVRVLGALRRACPAGPVLVSWSIAPARGLRGGATTVAAIAGRAPPRPERAVSHFGLFHAVLDEARLRSEASEAGYEVVYVGAHDDGGFPHAVLRPAAPTRAA